MFMSLVGLYTNETMELCAFNLLSLFSTIPMNFHSLFKLSTFFLSFFSLFCCCCFPVCFLLLHTSFCSHSFHTRARVCVCVWCECMCFIAPAVGMRKAPTLSNSRIMMNENNTTQFNVKYTTNEHKCPSIKFNLHKFDCCCFSFIFSFVIILCELFVYLLLFDSLNSVHTQERQRMTERIKLFERMNKLIYRKTKKDIHN